MAAKKSRKSAKAPGPTGSVRSGSDAAERMRRAHGKLHLVFGARDERSYIKQRYYSAPFNVAALPRSRNDKTLEVVFMSSAPGILDGDDYDIRLRSESGSRVKLGGQAYQRLLKMKSGSRQHQRIDMDDDAVLSFIQHPLVPHEGSDFSGESTLQVGDGCLLLFSEIITCGRLGRGERFAFKRLRNSTSLRHNERLLFKDNVILEPSSMDLESIGNLEGYTHQGMLLACDTRGDEGSLLEAACREYLNSDQFLLGVSRPAPTLVVVRALGKSGETMYDAFKQLEAGILASI